MDERAPLAGGSSAAPRKKTNLIALFAVLAGVTLCFAVLAVALAFVTDASGWNEPELSKRVQLERVLEHLEQLEAAAHTGRPEVPTRALGTPGYATSVGYVQQQLAAFDEYFDVSVQKFAAGNWQLASAALNVGGQALVEGQDYGVATGSTAGATAVPLGAAAVDNSGCVEADWAKFDDVAAPLIVVVPFGGGCTAASKVAFATSANVAAVALTQAENAQGYFRTRVATPNTTAPVPVFAVPLSLGAQLLSGAVATFDVNAALNYIDTYNVIAATKSGAKDSVVLVGAHLDSVPAGPGINDDGSGTAVVLELALQMARDAVQVKSQVRFAWWGAEEIGLLGSRYYVENADPMDRANWVAYLNNDMLGSPNFNRNVMRVNNASIVVPERAMRGSDKITELYAHHFEQQQVTYIENVVDAPGSSDYGYFLLADIAAGAVSTGAGVVKDQRALELFGGIKGAINDPCYHQRCDDTSNISAFVLGQNARALADVVQEIAFADNAKQFIYGTDGPTPETAAVARFDSAQVREAHMQAWQFRVDGEV